MCNPPFYGSREEVAKSANEKDFAPNAVSNSSFVSVLYSMVTVFIQVCTGADIEMIFDDGGEEGFVGEMVNESERFQTRCK